MNATADCVTSGLNLSFQHRMLEKAEGFTTETVVLCFLPENKHTPYVTWRVDHHGNCYWGHYFKAEGEARDDFKKRVKP